jgi:hypothetical protein
VYEARVFSASTQAPSSGSTTASISRVASMMLPIVPSAMLVRAA